MSDTIIRSQILVSATCPTCGVLHAFPEEINEQMLAKRGPSGRSIYCPNGHSWWYTGKTEAERERDRRRAAEQYAQDLCDELGAEKRSHSATKGQLTKTRKRVSKGICPCCNRHFTNVERHMASQHPDYAETP